MEEEYERERKAWEQENALDEVVDADDIATVVAQWTGIPVNQMLETESEKLLRGSVLDYDDGLHGAGLKFQNPNAGHDCGCGASFAAAADKAEQD